MSDLETERLIKASVAGNIQLVQQLVAAGVHQRAGLGGPTALQLAAVTGQHEVVRTLLAAGFDRDIDVVCGKAGTGTCGGLTPLHLAVTRGRLQVVQVLLEAGANLEATALRGTTDRWAGWTPLHSAADHNGPDGHQLVRLLLDAGAQVDAAGADGSTPLHLAALQGHTDVVRPLLVAGANVNAARADGVTPLCAAAAAGHSEVVRAVLVNQANVNAANQGGVTPLLAAAAAGHTEIVQQLLNAGANVHAAQEVGMTAIHAAAAAGHLEVVQQLLAAGANIQATMANGSTPLYAAAAAGHLSVVKELLHNSASPQSGVGDHTALTHAASHGDAGMVEALLDAWGQPKATAAALVRAAQLAATEQSKAAFARLVLELQKLHPAEVLQLLQGLPAAAYPTAMAAVLELCAGALGAIAQQQQDVAQEKQAVQQLILYMAGMAKIGQQAHVAEAAPDDWGCNGDEAEQFFDAQSDDFRDL